MEIVWFPITSMVEKRINFCSLILSLKTSFFSFTEDKSIKCTNAQIHNEFLHVHRTGSTRYSIFCSIFSCCINCTLFVIIPFYYVEQRLCHWFVYSIFSSSIFSSDLNIFTEYFGFLSIAFHLLKIFNTFPVNIYIIRRPFGIQIESMKSNFRQFVAIQRHYWCSYLDCIFCNNLM